MREDSSFKENKNDSPLLFHNYSYYVTTWIKLKRKFISKTNQGSIQLPLLVIRVLKLSVPHQYLLHIASADKRGTTLFVNKAKRNKWTIHNKHIDGKPILITCLIYLLLSSNNKYFHHKYIVVIALCSATVMKHQQLVNFA